MTDVVSAIAEGPAGPPRPSRASGGESGHRRRPTRCAVFDREVSGCSSMNPWVFSFKCRRGDCVERHPLQAIDGGIERISNLCRWRPEPRMTPWSGDSRMSSTSPGVTYRFGEFEVDVAAYELRREGQRVPLARQPMDLLLLLLERRQELVSREDIAKRLWGPDVFTDLDAGIHTAILKIRQVLGDSRESPRFVETVPGKGYRFVAPVEVVSPIASADVACSFDRTRTSARPASPQPAGRAHELRRTSEGAPRIARRAQRHRGCCR